MEAGKQKSREGVCGGCGVEVGWGGSTRLAGEMVWVSGPYSLSSQGLE